MLTLTYRVSTTGHVSDAFFFLVVNVNVTQRSCPPAEKYRGCHGNTFFVLKNATVWEHFEFTVVRNGAVIFGPLDLGYGTDGIERPRYGTVRSVIIMALHGTVQLAHNGYGRKRIFAVQ